MKSWRNFSRLIISLKDLFPPLSYISSMIWANFPEIWGAVETQTTQIIGFLEKKVAVIIDGYKCVVMFHNSGKSVCVTSVWHRQAHRQLLRLLTAVSRAPGHDICLLAFRMAVRTFFDYPVPVLTCTTLRGHHQHQWCLHDKRSLKLLFIFFFTCMSIWSTQSMCCKKIKKIKQTTPPKKTAFNKL